MSAEERKFVLGRYRVKFATDEFDTIAVPGLDDLSLREPRVVPPASVAPFARPTAMIASRTPTAKYPDYVRAMLGDYNYAPDVVAWRTAGALSVCRRQAVAGAPRRDRSNRRRHPPPRRSSTSPSQATGTKRISWRAKTCCSMQFISILQCVA